MCICLPSLMPLIPIQMTRVLRMLYDHINLAYKSGESSLPEIWVGQ